MRAHRSPSTPDTGPDDLATVRRIIFDGLRGHAARVLLFGSRARGDQRAGSDIDVAVLPLVPIPRGVLAAIREALAESRVPFAVDLVDLSETPAALRERALREGTEWTDLPRD